MSRSISTSGPHLSFREKWQMGSGEMVLRYLFLLLMLLISVGPFVWQVSTSFKGPADDIYAYPPSFIPADFTTENYAQVMRTIPVINYAWHSLVVAGTMVITNVLFATLAGYAFGALRWRGKGILMALVLSTLLLPAEVTLTSQYLTIKSLGFADSLVGVILPGAIGAINVLLMTAAAAAIPPSILEAARIDGANTWQRIRHVVWPNVRGMASVVGLMSFIQGWDDFLWPLVVLSDPEKYTLTVGMQYLQSNFGSDPRIVAAGTVIALVPIIILFAAMQKQFFKGVESGGVKG